MFVANLEEEKLFIVELRMLVRVLSNEYYSSFLYILILLSGAKLNIYRQSE